MEPAPAITLLTDFGLSDYYVAAVKGVLTTLAPGISLVDISHQVRPGGVQEAQFLLEAAFPTFPPRTVHLVVVDPGVGSHRRLLVVRYEGSYLVAPDNGVLTPFVETGEVRGVNREDLYGPGLGDTFHGRDRLAPIAASLARGEPFESMGPLVNDPIILSLPKPRRSKNSIQGQVIHIDHYGNLVTNLPSSWFQDQSLEINIAGRTVQRIVSHYAEIEKGEVAAIPGSLGLLEFSLRGRSLAALLGATEGMTVNGRIGNIAE